MPTTAQGLKDLLTTMQTKGATPEQMKTVTEAYKKNRNEIEASNPYLKQVLGGVDKQHKTFQSLKSQMPDVGGEIRKSQMGALQEHRGKTGITPPEPQAPTAPQITPGGIAGKERSSTPISKSAGDAWKRGVFEMPASFSDQQQQAVSQLVEAGVQVHSPEFDDAMNNIAAYRPLTEAQFEQGDRSIANQLQNEAQANLNAFEAGEMDFEHFVRSSFELGNKTRTMPFTEGVSRAGEAWEDSMEKAISSIEQATKDKDEGKISNKAYMARGIGAVFNAIAGGTAKTAYGLVQPTIGPVVEPAAEALFKGGMSVASSDIMQNAIKGVGGAAADAANAMMQVDEGMAEKYFDTALTGGIGAIDELYRTDDNFRTYVGAVADFAEGSFAAADLMSMGEIGAVLTKPGNLTAIGNAIKESTQRGIQKGAQAIDTVSDAAKLKVAQGKDIISKVKEVPSNLKTKWEDMMVKAEKADIEYNTERDQILKATEQRKLDIKKHETKQQIKQGVDGIFQDAKTLQKKATKIKRLRNVNVVELLQDPKVYKALSVDRKTGKINVKEAVKVVDERLDSNSNIRQSLIPSAGELTTPIKKEEILERAIDKINSSKGTTEVKKATVKKITKTIDSLPDEVDLILLEAERAGAEAEVLKKKNLQQLADSDKAYRDTVREIIFEKMDNLPAGEAGVFARVSTAIKRDVYLKEFLEDGLASKVLVKGGKLTKLINKGVGAVIGSPGGPLVSYLGYEVAGNLTEIMFNQQLKLKVKKEVLESLLQDAPGLHKEALKMLDEIKAYQKPQLQAGTSGYASQQIGQDVIELGKKSQSVIDAEEMANIQSMLDTPEPKEIPLTEKPFESMPTEGFNKTDSDVLKSIETEAKKFDSPEEFVNAQTTIHRPPDAEPGTSLDDLIDVYGEDIYTPNALRYYGDAKDIADKKAVALIKSLRGKPDELVTLYRAIEPGEKATIKAGDWVTATEEYAKLHGEGPLKGSYEIITKDVPAKDLYTDGNSLQEYGYRPNNHRDLNRSELTELWNKVNKGLNKTDESLITEAKKFDSAEEFVESLNIVDSEILAKQAVREDWAGIADDLVFYVKGMFPKDIVKGKGVTKDVLLSKLRDFKLQNIEEFKTLKSFGKDTLTSGTVAFSNLYPEGRGFINNLVKNGYLTEIPTSPKIGETLFRINDKIDDYATKTDLKEIWNKANATYQGSNLGSGKAVTTGTSLDSMTSKLDSLAQNSLDNAEAIKLIKEVANNPNKTVTVYRASPGDKINSGDWVFITRQEAENFTSTPMGTPKKGYKVLSEEVKASDVGWSGKNLEFVYKP